MESTSATAHHASYKDPSGFVFKNNGKIYRHVAKCYAQHYDLLFSSGLYDSLAGDGLLISHTEINEDLLGSPDWYRTLLPRQLPDISYPYEWSFDQLRDAALLTLRIMKIAINHGMILKDATGFNIQFEGSNPVFIDTLSFEKYDPLMPWVAYRQFCECFLFPLLLEYYLKCDMQKLLLVHLEGIPVKMTAGLLPLKSRFRLSVWLHVLLQNKVRGEQTSNQAQIKFSKIKMIQLIDHLTSTVSKLQTDAAERSTWNTYYSETILSRNYLEEKEKLFRVFTEDIGQGRVLDLGCNDGFFSRILLEKNSHVVAVDFDSHCVNSFYLTLKKESRTGILPLCMDLSNPSPSCGFRNTERQSFEERFRSETVLALALIHHLVLSKNIRMVLLAEQMAALATKYLIIEFVPLEDEKAQQLVRQKPVFHKPYDAQAFEECFTEFFSIERKEPIQGSQRILYRMKKK
jgi:hypothetical protein